MEKNNEEVKKKKSKKIKDSIMLSKGYQKVHHRIMKWRKISYFSLIASSVLTLALIIFEIVWTVKSDTITGIAVWLIITLIMSLVLYLGEFNAIYYLLQKRIHFCCYVNFALWINLLAAILTQDLSEGLNESWNKMTEKVILVIVSICIGSTILIFGLFKIYAYYFVFLKIDPAQKNLVKKALSKEINDQDGLHHSLVPYPHEEEDGDVDTQQPIFEGTIDRVTLEKMEDDS